MPFASVQFKVNTRRPGALCWASALWGVQCSVVSPSLPSTPVLMGVQPCWSSSRGRREPLGPSGPPRRASGTLQPWPSLPRPHDRLLLSLRTPEQNTRASGHCLWYVSPVSYHLVYQDLPFSLEEDLNDYLHNSSPYTSFLSSNLPLLGVPSELLWTRLLVEEEEHFLSSLRFCPLLGSVLGGCKLN